MGIESFLIASSVLAVVGQRLVRRICPSCKTPLHAHRRGAGVLRGERRPAGEGVFYHGTGCNFCGGTGYQGANRRLRAPPDDAGDQAAHRGMGDPGGAAQPGQEAGHAHAAPRGHQPRGAGHHVRITRSYGACTRYERSQRQGDSQSSGTTRSTTTGSRSPASRRPRRPAPRTWRCSSAASSRSR